MLSQSPIGQTEAARLAARLHRDQVDKAGAPYVEHLRRVAIAVARMGGTLDQIVAGWLHDAIEDGHIDAAGLHRAGVAPGALRLIEILTHPVGEVYDAYITRVAADPGARLVKLCDVHDNAGRLDGIDDVALRERLAAKYTRALERLDGSGGT